VWSQIYGLKVRLSLASQSAHRRGVTFWLKKAPNVITESGCSISNSAQLYAPTADNRVHRTMYIPNRGLPTEMTCEIRQSAQISETLYEKELQRDLYVRHLYL